MEQWDTYEGRVVDSKTYTVGAEGTLELTLPPMARDIALRMREEN